MSTHTDRHDEAGTAEPTPKARDPFGLGLPRRPDWESFGIRAEDDETHAHNETVIEVRRRGWINGVVGLLAAGLGLAWLGRALSDPQPLAWVVTALLGVIAVAYLAAFADSRVPLAVLDAHGVRMRLGRTWQGLPWESVEAVEHAEAASHWRDGRLVVRPFEERDVVAALDLGARWHAWWAQRWFGGAFALPLGPSTRITGTRDVATTLDEVVDPAVAIVHPAPVDAPEPEAVEPAETDQAEPVQVAAPDDADSVDTGEIEAIEAIEAIGRGDRRADRRRRIGERRSDLRCAERDTARGGTGSGGVGPGRSGPGRVGSGGARRAGVGPRPVRGRAAPRR